MRKKILANKVALSIGGAVVAIAAVGGAWWYIGSNQAPSFSTVTVGMGNVVSSINEPGSVLADNDVDLAFQESGQISSVNVTEGESVAAGTVLAALSQSGLQAALEQAQAGLAVAQANLAGLQSGTRTQQLAVDQTAVSDAASTLSNDIGTAYVAADDAIHNQTDNLYQSPINPNNPVLLPSFANTQIENNIVTTRVTIGNELTQWYLDLNNSNTSPTQLYDDATSTLGQVQSYLDMMALGLDSASPSTALAGYKADVVTARTEVDAAITTITSAASTLASAQSELTLAEAGSTAQQIQAQQALVQQAQAQVASAQVAVNNSQLTAPFGGIVDNLTAQVGQVVSPNAPVMSITNNGELKIQTYVSESDISQVKVGDKVNVTLDAYGTGTIFPATVTAIDPGETEVNGTPAYLVTIYFTNPNSEIKSGMTGNVQIIIAEHDNVVEAPTQLVINNGTGSYVVVEKNGAVQNAPVQVGLTGDNGMTEITSGLTAGEQIVNF